MGDAPGASADKHPGSSLSGHRRTSVPLTGPGRPVRRESEFLNDSQTAAAEMRITHYFLNPPRYPQDNGRIERSFRTDEDESTI